MQNPYYRARMSLLFPGDSRWRRLQVRLGVEFALTATIEVDPGLNGFETQGQPMSEETKLLFLRPVLILFGLVCIFLLPLSKIWPPGFIWHDEATRSYYFEMICVVYFTLGIFLLMASRNPLDHLSLIWFTAWSSVAHGGLMLVQSLDDWPHHGPHLMGDVPLLFFGAAMLFWLTPRRFKAAAPQS